MHELIARGLVDEYRLFVYPIVMGAGRGCSRRGPMSESLRLVDCRPFRSGIVLTRYSANG